MAFQSDAFQSDAFQLGSIQASFIADAIFTAPISANCAADAVLRRTVASSFSADAALAGQFTADAVIVNPTVVASLTADSIISREADGSGSVDAITRWTQAGAVSVDALLRRISTGSITAAAIKFRTQSGTKTASAIVKSSGSGSVSANSWIVITTWVDFPVDAVLRANPSFTAQATIVSAAWRGGSFSVDALIPYGIFTANAYIRVAILTWPNGTFTANAVIDGPPIVEPPPTPITSTPQRVSKIKITILDGARVLDPTEIDVTPNVIWADTSFTQQAKTGAGTFRLTLKGSCSWNGGQIVLVEIDGLRQFGGYVLQVERDYFFSAVPEPRTTLFGTDFNILFDKLVCFNRDWTRQHRRESGSGSGPYHPIPDLPKDSTDKTVIQTYCEHYLDIPRREADPLLYEVPAPIALNYTDYVDAVGTPCPDTPFRMNDMDSFRLLMANCSQFTQAVWFIDAYMNLHSHSRDTVTAPATITDGAGGISCRDLSIETDASMIVNDDLVWGTLAQTVSGEVVGKHATDASSITSYGLWQHAEWHTDMHIQNHIDRRADIIVNRYKNPVVRATCTIFEPGFQAGQVARLDVASHNLNRTMVIRQIEITFVSTGYDDGVCYGIPRYHLTLGLDPEEPWSFYDALPFEGFDLNTNIGGISFPHFELTLPRFWVATLTEQCEMLDTFTRTIGPFYCSAEPDWGENWPTAWGTSDSGIPWTLDWANRGDDYAGVNGSVGYLHLGAWNDLCSIYMEDAGGPWTRSTGFLLTFKFKIDHIPSGISNLVELSFDGYSTLHPVATGVYLGIGTAAGQGWLSLGIKNPTGDYAKTDWVADTWYIVKYEHRPGVRARAKVWEASGTEPDWQVTATDLSKVIAFGPFAQMQMFGESSLPTDFYVDDIQFCATVCVTDTFTRTVANGWGTSDAGFVWGTASGGTDSPFSVNGTQGILDGDAMATPTFIETDLPLGDGVTLPVTFQIGLTISDVSGSNDWEMSLMLSNGVFGGSSRSSGGVNLVNQRNNHNDIFLNCVHNPQGSFVSLQANTVSTLSGAYGVPLWLKVSVEPTIVRAKLWLQSEAEPTDWQAVRSQTDSGGHSLVSPCTYFEFESNLGTPPDSGYGVVVDNLVIDGVCGSAATTGGAGKGWGCETITPSAGQFTLSKACAAGSLSVYDVDGNYLIEGTDWEQADATYTVYTVLGSPTGPFTCCYLTQDSQMHNQAASPKNLSPSSPGSGVHFPGIRGV